MIRIAAGPIGPRNTGSRTHSRPREIAPSSWKASSSRPAASDSSRLWVSEAPSAGRRRLRPSARPGSPAVTGLPVIDQRAGSIASNRSASTCASPGRWTIACTQRRGSVISPRCQPGAQRTSDRVTAPSAPESRADSPTSRWKGGGRVGVGAGGSAVVSGPRAAPRIDIPGSSCDGRRPPSAGARIEVRDARRPRSGPESSGLRPDRAPRRPPGPACTSPVARVPPSPRRGRWPPGRSSWLASFHSWKPILRRAATAGQGEARLVDQPRVPNMLSTGCDFIQRIVYAIVSGGRISDRPTSLSIHTSNGELDHGDPGSQGKSALPSFSPSSRWGSDSSPGPGRS